jgi:glutamyl-tRNA synthetase
LILEAAELLDVNYEKPVYYKSDRLKIYYDYAEKLIEKGRAYVCYCSQEELRDNRAKGVECSCRKFPLEIQRGRWKEMFKEEEGHAVLRIKTDMQHPNPAFRDRVLFKISDREHPRVGKKYRVWPTLEMSWAIDDYLLGVTHIIRGNELMIETDMEKYIWDIFKWKHCTTIHSGLIKIEGMGAKISKSKNQKEIKEGKFTGWDDPRTWSIQSLIRRGIRKEAIRAFVEEIGLNKQDITVPIESLYAHNRRLIDRDSLRFYFVENPAVFSAPEELKDKKILVPVHPDTPDKTREILVRNVAISNEDYNKFKGEEVRLLHMCNVSFDNEMEITSYENKKIPRIQWVSQGLKARVLMPDGTWKEGLCEQGVKKGVKKGQVVQFERFGFCRYDGTHAGKLEFWFAHG